MVAMTVMIKNNDDTDDEYLDDDDTEVDSSQ